MSDSLSSFTVNRSDAGEKGPWTGSVVPSSVQSFSDTTPANPVLWYQLLQTTSGGVVVPYNTVSLVNLPTGTLVGTPDLANPGTINFSWTVPDKLPLPIGWFELSGKFQDEPESARVFVAYYGPDERSGSAYAPHSDDLSNPYTFQLVGFIPR